MAVDPNNLIDPAPDQNSIYDEVKGPMTTVWALWFARLRFAVNNIAASGGGGGGGGSGTPAPPVKSIQFNNSGVFGGDANLLYDSGTLSIITGGTSFRFTGDMSNATIKNRFAFKTTTVNGATRVHALPNGSGTVSTFNCSNLADPTDSNFAQIGVSSTRGIVSAGQNSGVPTALPFVFSNNTIDGFLLDLAANFQFLQGISSKVVSKTGNYTLVQSDHIVFADSTSGAITLTLPAANIAGAGFAPWYLIKRMDSSANLVTVTRAGADTIDGGTTFVLGALQSCEIHSDGSTKWGVL